MPTEQLDLLLQVETTAEEHRSNKHARIIRALILRLGGRVTLTSDELTADYDNNLGMILNHPDGSLELIALSSR
ncbi:hypothetical protein EKL30_01075 [Candidimonas sp. SYP-B2681]|uniref:hypothetical protein n=1 Tax=Candidimonas sp. SYP-B2681 TaxID=2497686 RepID=UPI000F896FE2|nr:hypothetical protein [Candidimonas sp. SYP-B2681]RTZ47624.1 hypothetical protein EKL30_01075 [Candidimonas sp. SYP-B2681]